ncbi:MAG: hypothetical protein HKO59_16400 [Phycisphaerales bacterium]|nr:hypothetical protein [Phycisphaerales bacterium]NNM27533.1 hypothetical protein [Phycisphaerales bacterium]
MFKFLRLYNKWILAVGGTLLMIVFLAPQAIQTLSQRAALGGAVWATIGGTDVPAEVRRECEQELQIIEALSRAAPTLAITDRPEHWYLLVREADQAGLLGGRASDLLSADQMEVLFQVAGRSQLVDQAVGKRLAIDRLLLMYQGAAKLSDNRLRRMAERMFHGVEARVLVIEAEADASVEPTEAAIAAQFEKYRDIAPGGEPEEPGQPAFGYRLPDRFKIEWLTVAADDVRALVESTTGQDGVALFKHWQQHAASRGFPSPEPGQEVPEVVVEDLVKEKTTETLDVIQRFANDQLLASWRRLSLRDGYYQLPATWSRDRVAFPDLATRIQSEFPGLTLPAYEAIGDRWLTTDDIADIEPLNRAQTSRFGNRVMTAATLVGAIQEFGGDPVVVLQAGVAGPPLRDQNDDSIVLFRITEADAARPARDVSEVREEVVADLRRAAAYERLKSSLDTLASEARTKGLLQLALERGRELPASTRVKLDDPRLLAFSLQNNIQIPRASDLPVVGAHKPTIEAIIDHALSLPPETPAAELPVEERVYTLPIDEKMAVAVVELVGQAPLDRETFNDLVGTGGVQAMLIGEELADTEQNVRDVFSYDALATRHDFVLRVRATQPDGEVDGEGEDEEATAAATTGS